MTSKLNDNTVNIYYLTYDFCGHLFESGLAEWFWLRGLSWGCSQDVIWGFSHLKIWLGPKVLLDSSLSQLWAEGLCRNPQLLATCTSPYDYLSDLKWWEREKGERKEVWEGVGGRGTFCGLVTPSLRSSLLSPATCKGKGIKPCLLRRSNKEFVDWF